MECACHFARASFLRRLLYLYLGFAEYGRWNVPAALLPPSSVPAVHQRLLYEPVMEPQVVGQQIARPIRQNASIASGDQHPRIVVPVLDVALIDRDHRPIATLSARSFHSRSQHLRQANDVDTVRVIESPVDEIERETLEGVDRFGTPRTTSGT